MEVRRRAGKGEEGAVAARAACRLGCVCGSQVGTARCSLEDV